MEFSVVLLFDFLYLFKSTFFWGGLDLLIIDGDIDSVRTVSRGIRSMLYHHVLSWQGRIHEFPKGGGFTFVEKKIELKNK